MTTKDILNSKHATLEEEEDAPYWNIPFGTTSINGRKTAISRLQVTGRTTQELYDSLCAAKNRISVMIAEIDKSVNERAKAATKKLLYDIHSEPLN